MQITRRLFVVASLAMSVPSFGWADDAASRAIVEKAIEVHGGEKAIAKFKASSSKIKGSIYINGAAVSFTGEIDMQAADQLKAFISFVLDGQSISFVSVLNRGQGWLKINNDTVDMPAEVLADTKEAAFTGWVTTLVPLKDKAFTLAPFGEAEIAGRKVIGVNVTREGHRPINLFFDQETSRLVRTESRVRDETSGQEVTEESTYSEYKPVDGVQHPTKITVKRNDKTHADVEVTELKLVEKLDDNVFAKP